MGDLEYEIENIERLVDVGGFEALAKAFISLKKKNQELEEKIIEHKAATKHMKCMQGQGNTPCSVCCTHVRMHGEYRDLLNRVKNLPDLFRKTHERRKKDGDLIGMNVYECANIIEDLVGKPEGKK